MKKQITVLQEIKLQIETEIDQLNTTKKLNEQKNIQLPKEIKTENCIPYQQQLGIR